MTSKAITGLGSKSAEAKRSVGYIAVDSIATRGRQAQPFGTTTASAQCTYLEASQPSPAVIHHHHRLHLPYFHHRHHRRLHGAVLRRPSRLKITTQTFNPQKTHKKFHPI
ncbi:hypothetical protein L1049_021212 [Liquidambar formosana]|uniref:Uncharacterized protein n=1 Tax=Liquidambar formosana TaxID=63359 RepID=A0AAP0SDS4_LIQFO